MTRVWPTVAPFCTRPSLALLWQPPPESLAGLDPPYVNHQRLHCNFCFSSQAHPSLKPVGFTPRRAFLRLNDA